MTFSSANLPNVTEFSIFPSSLLLLFQFNDYIFVNSRFSATSELELTIQRKVKSNIFIHLCPSLAEHSKSTSKESRYEREHMIFHENIIFENENPTACWLSTRFRKSVKTDDIFFDTQNARHTAIPVTHTGWLVKGKM